MGHFLQIIGAITLALVGVVLFFVFLQLWLGRRFGHRSLSPPSTVELEPEAESATDWLQTAEVRRDLATLARLGFVQGPTYAVPAMPGLSLVGLVHPGSGLMAVRYHRRKGRPGWVDLCAYVIDGPELTVANAARGHEMDTPPWTEKIFRKDMPVEDMHALLLERVAGRAVRAITREDFPATFREAYARTMAWRNAKGGTSREELMRVAAGRSRPLTEEQLNEAFKRTKLKELLVRSGETLKAFEKSTTLSVAEWKRYEHRMFILRDDFHPAAYLDYLTRQITIAETDLARYRDVLAAGLSFKGLLDRIATDTGHQFAKLGEVTEPIAVEIYGVTLPADRPA